MGTDSNHDTTNHAEDHRGGAAGRTGAGKTQGADARPGAGGGAGAMAKAVAAGIGAFLMLAGAVWLNLHAWPFIVREVLHNDRNLFILYVSVIVLASGANFWLWLRRRRRKR